MAVQFECGLDLLLILPAIATEPVGFRALHEVDALRELIFVVDVVVQGQVVVREAGAGNVRRRIELQQSDSGTVKSCGRNHVAWKGQEVIPRIIDESTNLRTRRRQKLQKIAVAHGRR